MMVGRHRERIGIVYLAVGEAYQRLTSIGVQALRSAGYAGPIRVLCGQHAPHIDHPDCELVALPPVAAGFGSRFYKTKINEFAFETTLFLDADTLVLSSVRRLWRELRFADICMSLEHPTVRHLMMERTDNGEACPAELAHMRELGLLNHLYFNTGVILFHCSVRTDRLFKAWHEEWTLFREADQLAMVRAVARTGIDIHALAPRWNHRSDKYAALEQARSAGVRILHFTADKKQDLLAAGGQFTGCRLRG
jgi:hypothetical protein